MDFKNIFSGKKQPTAATTTSAPSSDIVMKLAQEFQDRSRKNIKKWRDGITACESPDDPRWYLTQDLIDDLILDAHLSSVIDVRKLGTLNHRFYVTDINSGEQLDEQSKFLNKQWFYEFLDVALDAIFRKYTVVQFSSDGISPKFTLIPHRNICPQLHRVYLEVGGSQFIDYKTENAVIEIMHSSKFGLINTVAPNVIWKRNLIQSNAEFSERFGMPLITATTANKADVPRIDAGLKNLGEAGTGVLPKGTEITVHALANAGNPEKVYLDPAKFHDNQVSKCIVGSTTMVDEGANRAQTQVHQETLDDKISASDKRMITFIVNDQLFPVLQSFGFPFDPTKMEFKFDENEDLTLSEQWKITSDALKYYELDEAEVKKTFKLPIIGKITATAAIDKTKNGNFKSATAFRAMAVACNVQLPEYDHENYNGQPATAGTGIGKSLLDDLNFFDEQIAKNLFQKNLSNVERNRLLKGKRIAEELRDTLFQGWGKRRVEMNWNAPDNRALSMMEINLFRFAESKTKAEVLMLNRLLIDRDKLEIRSEKDFIDQAKKVNATFNENYLRTERNFAIATGQNSARWFEFIGEKNSISNWQYQTVGDDQVRDEHAILDGKVFAFDDTEARRMWPPNAYGCRCEGIQFPGKPSKVESGNDYISQVFTTESQRKNFAVNRAESGIVFNQNQMYINQLTGIKNKKLNDYTFNDYGLQKWSELKDTLKPLKLDNTITPDNVNELFKNNADTPNYKAMGFDDYLKRKLIMKEKTFNYHSKGKYIKENRPQLFAHVGDILKQPDELWLNEYTEGNKTQQQLRYIKFFQNDVIVVDCKISGDALEVKTWYQQKVSDETLRVGLLIK